MQRIATASRRLRASKRQLATHTAGRNDSGRTVPSQVPTLKRLRNTRSRRYGKAVIEEGVRHHEEAKRRKEELSRFDLEGHPRVADDALLVKSERYIDDSRAEYVKGARVKGHYFGPDEVQAVYLYTEVDESAGLQGMAAQVVHDDLRVELPSGESVSVGSRRKVSYIDTEPDSDPRRQPYYGHSSVCVKPKGQRCRYGSRKMRDAWHYIASDGRYASELRYREKAELLDRASVARYLRPHGEEYVGPDGRVLAWSDDSGIPRIYLSDGITWLEVQDLALEESPVDKIYR